MTVNEEQNEYRQAAEQESLPPEMKRVREGLLAEAEAEVAALPRDPETGEWADIPLTNCQIEFVIPVHSVSDLSEALDVAAVSLIRLGMDSFHIKATDPDTGDSWVIHNGEVWTAEDYLNGVADGTTD